MLYELHEKQEVFDASMVEENYASRNKEIQWHADLHYLRELLYQTIQATKNK